MYGAVGMAARAIDLMKIRISNRSSFGKLLKDRDSVQLKVGKIRIQYEQVRLLVLNAAHLSDIKGYKMANLHIAMA